jgi:hypothetical protein
MDGDPLLVLILVNQECFATTLVDTGCLFYGVASAFFVQKNNLKRIPINPRSLSGFDGVTDALVTEVAVVRIDIDGHTQDRVYLYIVPKLSKYDMIMGLPWIIDQEIRVDPKGRWLKVGPSRTKVLNMTRKRRSILQSIQVAGITFGRWKKRQEKDQTIEIFAASLADINKALRVKTPTDPRTKLPRQYWEFLLVFDREKADQLPPFQGGRIDHKIILDQTNGKDAEVPWGPMYNMSREELLVLRKTLTELLDKQFVRVSNSPAAAPVLFVRKPGGGLRFCVDYCGLNRVTRKNRYPLPLIQETLRNIGKAK